MTRRLVALTRDENPLTGGGKRVLVEFTELSPKKMLLHPLKAILLLLFGEVKILKG